MVCFGLNNLKNLSMSCHVKGKANKAKEIMMNRKGDEEQLVVDTEECENQKKPNLEEP